MVGRLAKEMMTSTDSNALYGFIAKDNEQIIGAVFFTRMVFENSINAFLLSPMAIRTEHQGKGVGRKLINFGLETLKKDGVELVLTYGDPHFYSKVGFSVVTEKILPAPLPLTMPEGWLAQSLRGDKIKPIAGKSHCVKALNDPELW